MILCIDDENYRCDGADRKNWSLLYLGSRAVVLSPAYDLVAMLPYNPDDNLALTLGGSRSFYKITLDQVRRFAGVAREPMNPVWAIVRATVERTAEAWKALP